MKYQIEIECDNAAFYNPDDEHDPAAELASIITALVRERLAMGETGDTNLYDTNGNKVGFAGMVG